jgi:hypothetical protein
MTRAHPILNPDFGKKVVRLVITVVGLLILRATLDALSTAAAQKSWVGFANGNVAQDRDADPAATAAISSASMCQRTPATGLPTFADTSARHAPKCAIGKETPFLATRYPRGAIETARD